MKKFSIIFVISIFLLQPCPAASSGVVNPASLLLQRWFGPVSQDDAQAFVDPRITPLAALARFYRCHEFQPAWVDHGGPLPHTEILMQAIRHAPGEGLRAMDYDVRNLETGLGRDALFSDEPVPLDDYGLVRLDVALTNIMLTYAAHLSEGRVRPEELSETFTGSQKASLRDLPCELASALNENRLSGFIEGLSPRHRPYQDLKKALRRYRKIQAAGGWPQIAEGGKLRIGDRGPRVATLNRHLTITGDLMDDAWMPGDLFSPSLETAVKKYQRRHGLKTDGIVGPHTLAVLNTPVEGRMLQLMLNMERWRWVPENLGPRYVMVNIPGFELRLMENQALVLSIRAIVGQKDRPTPVLSGQLTYLEVNPYWNVPQKIARQDLLPKIQADPGYLNRQGIRVFDSWQEDAPELDPLEIDWERLSEDYFPFRLRQEPAAHNALGRVKFMFPNRQSVYIHDTPGKSLFNLPQRPFSSGCVRVEEPLALAVHLLKDQHWDRRRLERAIGSDQRRTIFLQTPVPVYLVYFTAWTDAGGDVHFREDIYDHDRRLLLALFHSAPSLDWCSFIAGSSDPATGSISPAL